jgi:tetratricopeptide (TPR) repeat protein
VSKPDARHLGTHPDPHDSSMLTDSDVVISIESPPAAGSTGPLPRAHRRRATGVFRRVVKTIAAWGLVAGLIGFNVWWYRRETQPLPGPRTVDDWIAKGEFVQAEAALKERLRRAPHDVQARLSLSRLLAARGDLLGCAHELQKVPYWSPQKAEATFRSAQAFLQADRARDAEVALLTILDADPLHPPDQGLYHDASQELLKIYAIEDRWEDAYPVMWKAFDRADPPDRPAMLTMRIRAALERVSQVETLKLLKGYVAADPVDFEALRALANAELAVGQGTEAVQHMEACLRTRPDDSRAWRDYLTMLQSLGEQEAFAAAIARVPTSGDREPEIWMFRGQVKEREGNWEGAAADYRQALDRDPNLLNAHYRLATIEARLGHRDQAMPHRKRWDELRQAQLQLRRVDAEYRAALAAASAPEPKPSAMDDLRAAARRLGSVCATLGWARAAEACRQIVASL